METRSPCVSAPPLTIQIPYDSLDTPIGPAAPAELHTTISGYQSNASNMVYRLWGLFLGQPPLHKPQTGRNLSRISP
ncbi:hypothetical protein IG631_09582 [Alternaria alternata]|nr:hypothetical protein IG631_09582 [Alternaria alternata]